MKIRKGFTLIELLAAIVILAIIAVITVPVILSSIGKSRQGSTKTSAYQYLDAIEYYVATTHQDSDLNNDIALNGTVTSTAGIDLKVVNITLNDGVNY